MTPEPGKTIAGKYRLVKPLAAGGMGAVWVAHHEALDTEVAVKLMAVTLAQSPLAKTRFEREAKALARLKSPHVVHVHDFGVEDDTPYMVMELLHGEDLGSVLERERRLSPARASAILAQACKGIRVAHDAGIVHRDIKPSNIFLARMGGDEVVKILDFGIARATEPPSGQDRTASGILIGTPHFMSPEQARGAEAGPATDLWSLAVVLHVALTGKLPFVGESMGEVLAAILRDDPPKVSGAAPGLPPSLDDLFEKALAREPSQRFESATAFAEAFTRALSGESTLSVSKSGSPTSRPADEALGAAPTIEAGVTPAPVSGDVPTVQAPTIPPLRSPVPPSDRAAASPPSPPREETKPPTAPAAPARSWIPTVLVGVVAIAALVLAARGIRPREGEPLSGGETATSPAGDTPPRPTAITDLPPPVSDKPLALAHYGEALQAMRGASWDRATERLREATAEDPAFAAAHLRLAMTLTARDEAEARRSFERASDGRGRLSERDKVLLLAWEPRLRGPESRAAAIRAFRSAADRYPFDAELAMLAALNDDDDDRALAGLRRATELDPGYGDAWQALGDLLQLRGRTEEAARALDRCLEVAPTSVDCLISRARIRRALGRCAEVDADLREVLARSPRLTSAHDQLAQALMFQGVAPEAIADVFRRKWAVLPAEERAASELRDRIELEMYSGQLDALLRDADGIDEVTTAGPQAAGLSMKAEAVLFAMTEMGRPRDAALAAEAFAKRLEGQPPEAQLEMVPLLRVMARGGLLTKEAYRRRRDAWIDSHRPVIQKDPWAAWIAMFTRNVATREEALEALEARPEETGTRRSAGMSALLVARVHVLAGQPAEALVHFRRARQSCSSDFSSPPNQLAYGEALSATGDKEGACRAYAGVVARWGEARPRSITAEGARAKMASLRCPL